MVGFGPNNSSLLERVGKQFEMTLDWLEMDRSERGQARRVAAIRYGMKHKKQQKPLAPVEETTEKHYGDKARLWKWNGEEIASKGLLPGDLYASDQIREAGFRLPKLKKLERRCKEKHEGGVGCDVSFECWNDPSRCIRCIRKVKK